VTRQLHIIVGLLGVATFLATGVYMWLTYSPMDQLEDGPRLLLRSRHIYILFGSLLNLRLARTLSQAARLGGAACRVWARV